MMNSSLGFCVILLTFTTWVSATEIKLVKLPYDNNSLAPAISEQTMHFHYDIHLKGYVDNVNKLAKDSTKTLEELVTTSDEGSLFNNAAQVWNHELYFKCMTSDPLKKVMPAPLKEAINKSFGSFDDFKKQYTDVAMSHFGSGWIWLVLSKDASKANQLKITHTDNAMNPLKDGSGTAILATDVWEHSYYIDYRNRRAEHIKAWWGIVNWDFVGIQYDQARLAMKKNSDGAVQNTVSLGLVMAGIAISIFVSS